jgi:riboflavin biosynthesis pyrimidine reductase
MIAANLVDRIWVFQAASAVDDESAPSAASVPENFFKTGELQVGADLLTEYLNEHSAVFSALAPSADFVIAQRS